MLNLAVSIAHRLVVSVLDAALDVTKEEGLSPSKDPLTWWVTRLDLLDVLVGMLYWLLLCSHLSRFLFLIWRLLLLWLMILRGFINLLLPFLVRASALILLHLFLCGCTLFTFSISCGCDWLLFGRVRLIASWRWGNLLFLWRIGRLWPTLLSIVGSIFISIFVIFIFGAFIRRCKEALNGWDGSWWRWLRVLSNRGLSLFNFFLFDVGWCWCRIRLLTFDFFGRRRCPYLLIVTDLHLSDPLGVLIVLLLEQCSHGWEKVLELWLIEWIEEILMLHQLDLQVLIWLIVIG